MAATARRKVTVTYSGDVEGEQEIDAANNVASPAQIQYVTLSDGGNGFTVPDGATAVTIVKPTDNTTEIFLHAVDGLRLHNTDPDTISLHSSVTEVTLYLGPNPADEEVPTTSADLVGVRLFWS